MLYLSGGGQEGLLKVYGETEPLEHKDDLLGLQQALRKGGSHDQEVINIACDFGVKRPTDEG